MSSDYILYISFGLSFVTILLGALVLLQVTRQAYAWWFMAVCLFGAGWLLSSTFANNATDLFGADIANKLAFSLGFLAIYAGLIFSYFFPRRVQLTRYELPLFIIILVTGVTAALTSDVVGVPYYDESGHIGYTIPGAIILYVAMLSMMVVRLIANLRKNYIKFPADRKQIVLIGFAFAASIVIGVSFGIVLPSILGEWTSTLYSAFALLTLTVLVSYAIVKHQLFDIRTAAVRTLAYTLSLLVMSAIYFGLAYLVSVTIFHGASTTGVSMSPVNVVLALMLAFIFQPIKLFFDRVTNRIFYRDRYDTDDFITRLGDVLTSTTQLKQLLKTASNEIASTLKASSVSFVVYRADQGSDVVTNLPKAELMTSNEYDHIQQLVDDIDQPLLAIDELAQGRERQSGAHGKTVAWLQKRHVSLILSLGKLGYVILGEQKGSGYTRRDVKTLETIRDELVIAIQNARSVQEIREINTHLEQRVETATKELRRTNDKLRKIDETKDEFVSMASHQLRTPLTSIKGYISMLLDGDAGEMTEQQQKLLKEAFSSSERMVRLIGDFLNVSRLQTGKFIIERKPTNLAELVQGEVDAITSLAATRSIQLSYKGPKQFPTMQLDEDKIQQVVMNFIDNAIYYSRPNSTIAVHLRKDEKFAMLEVHDHGIGVPKEALEKLFTKFFRAENARRQRPDGTGVGLYLAKRVIQGHGGELIVESTEGKGSVFGFRLPLS